MRKTLFILTLVQLLSTFVFCGCNEYDYDDDYWKSVQREKVMRKSGFNDLADHEAKLRQDRLRFQKKPSPQKLNPANFAVNTIGVVIFIGFVVAAIHLSTKNSNKEVTDNHDASLHDIEANDKKEAVENNDVIDKLERLANLKDRGAITDNEFEIEKQKLLKH